jgi:hypothetical protein
VSTSKDTTTTFDTTYATNFITQRETDFYG